MRGVLRAACALLMATIFAEAGFQAPAPVAVNTPMGKVLQLLNDLKLQLEEDSHKEGELYNAYNQWCDLETQESKQTIATATAKIEDNEATLQEQEAFRAQTNSEIEALIAKISENEGDLKEAEAKRAEERQTYVETEKQMVEAIDQLERALEVLAKKQPGGETLPTANLFSVATTLKHALERNPDIPLNGAQQQTLDNFFKATIAMRGDEIQQGGSELQSPSFLQTGALTRRQINLLQVGQPTSSGVGQTLQAILDEQKKNRDAAMAEEQKSANAFALLQQSLSNEITNGNKAMEEKKSAMAQSQETSAQKTAELNELQNTLTTTQKYLDEVTAQCQQKARDWKERQKVRTDEIVAITEALTILSTPEAQRLATKQTMGTMFLQTGQVAHRAAHALHQGASSMAGRAGLSLLAVRSRVLYASRQGADPFQGVKKMIQEMIVRLLNEAAEEAEHKAWCDTEMSKSATSKTNREKDVQKMTDKITELEAQKAQLEDEAQELSRDMTDMSQNMAQATTQRTQEHAAALVAIKEYQDAQSLVTNAITVLKEFYAKREKEIQQSTSLAQVGEEPAAAPAGGNAPPPTFEGAYAGRVDASSGVVAILEVAISDFAQLEQETQTAEDVAQRDYDSLVNENNIRTAVAKKDLEYKETTKIKLESELQRTRSDLSGAQKELDAVNTYIEKLTPSCTTTEDPHEVRQARRQSEIESLQNALSILNGQGI